MLATFMAVTGQESDWLDCKDSMNLLPALVDDPDANQAKAKQANKRAAYWRYAARSLHETQFRHHLCRRPRTALRDAGNIVTYNVQAAPNGFVNSAWEFQDEPYAGDVINSYNDGSQEPAADPLGPFYEL